MTQTTDTNETTVTALHDGFDEPQVITDVLFTFPGEITHLMPAYTLIPVEFQNLNRITDWNKFVGHWLMRGNPFDAWDLRILPGVDGQLAIRHLATIGRSYQPKHKHKEAAMAWLLSRWFSSVTKK